MKGKKYLLIGLVFGVMIGWSLGFLRVPYVEKNNAFLLGFIAAMVCVALALFLLVAWNKPLLLGLMGKKANNGAVQSTRAHTFIWIILAGILVLGGVLGFQRNKSLVVQNEHQQAEIQEMEALVNAVQQNNLGPLLRSLLEDMGNELKQSPSRVLSDSSITRIADLSAALKPYRYIKGDSLSEQVHSPERGQLLQALVLMNIDSGIFTKIKELKMTFKCFLFLTLLS